MTKNDFQDCLINPLDLDKGQFLWEKHSALQKRKVFNRLPVVEEGVAWYKTFKKADLNSLIQFVIAFTDKKSPFAPERDFDLRLDKCVEGLQTTSNAIKEIYNETDLYQEMIHQYFMMMNQLDYEIWFSKTLTTHNMTRILRRPITLDQLDQEVKAIKSASDIIETMESDLKTRGAMLFLDSRLEQMISSKATEDDLTGYAEAYAKAPPYLQEDA